MGEMKRLFNLKILASCLYILDLTYKITLLKKIISQVIIYDFALDCYLAFFVKNLYSNSHL